MKGLINNLSWFPLLIMGLSWTINSVIKSFIKLWIIFTRKHRLNENLTSFLVRSKTEVNTTMILRSKFSSVNKLACIKNANLLIHKLELAKIFTHYKIARTFQISIQKITCNVDNIKQRKVSAEKLKIIVQFFYCPPSCPLIFPLIFLIVWSEWEKSNTGFNKIRPQ